MTTKTDLSDAGDWIIRIGVTAVIVAMITAVSACTPKTEIPPGFENDPLTVVRVFDDDVDAGLIDAALELIDDNVEFIDQTGRAFSGKSEVRSWLQEQADQDDESELSDLWLSGDKVVWAERVSNNGEMSTAKREAIVEQGKIKLFRILQEAR